MSGKIDNILKAVRAVRVRHDNFLMITVRINDVFQIFYRL
jgi:hypothetical protein